MTRALPSALKPAALIVLPLLAILLARGFTHTDWAAANATIAAWLFLWVVADALCLAVIAKAPDFRPGLRQLIGALGLAGIIVMVGAAEPVRAAILAMPPLVAALALFATVFAIWNGALVIRAWRRGGDWENALGEVLPPLLVRFTLAESRMMHLALFRWNAPRDIPPGAQGFAYHRYLTPMIAVLMGLQLFELGVMHLLLMLWNPTVAWIAFALSLAGFLWLVALLKSFRMMPVLLDDRGLRVRSGAVIDWHVPYDAIEGVVPPLSPDALKQRSTCNTAILSSPNVMVRLARPVAMPRLIGAPHMIEHIALKLDEPADFLAALEARLSRVDAP